MKFYKRLGIYKDYSGNCTFNPQTLEAYSYRWWRFVEKIGPFVVFNSYRYSNTTSKHQSKVRGVLHDLGIKVDFFIEAPKGLSDLSSAIRLYETRIEQLNADINRKGSRRAKNEERRQQIENLKASIELVRNLERLKTRKHTPTLNRTKALRRRLNPSYSMGA